MKIFVALKQFYRVFDMRPNQKSSFSFINSSALLILACSFCAIVAYMIYEENSTFDLGNLFYGSTTYLLNFITLAVNILKQKKIFKLIDNFETVMGKSEFQFINLKFSTMILNLKLFLGSNNSHKYTEVRAKIEKLSRINYFAFVKATVPCILLPKLISSYYNYFLGGYGSDAFTLNFPML